MAMARKIKRSEIVPSGQLDALVRKHVAEILAFQPWFLSREQTATVRTKQTIPEREKWKRYYARWGCLICRRKSGVHTGLGMCQTCHCRVHGRLKTIVRELVTEWPAARTREDIQELDRPIRTARALLLGTMEEK
jgi:hypothetical protein